MYVSIEITGVLVIDVEDGLTPEEAIKSIRSPSDIIRSLDGDLNLDSCFTTYVLDENGYELLRKEVEYDA